MYRDSGTYVYHKGLGTFWRIRFGASLFGDGFFGAIGTHCSTIWKLIDALRKVQKGRDAYYEKLLAGINPNPDPDQVLKFIKSC